MKKITFLMLTMLVFCWQSIGQVQVGSDTGTSTNVPITSCYGYSYSQQIYFASDINASGAITALSFYLDAATSAVDFTDSDDWTVYLGHSTKTEFTSTSDWEPLANLTQAYTGIVTFPAEDNWFTITLDTPFTYNGTDNLVVAIDENKTSYNCSMYWRKTDGAANTAMYYRSDSTNPDPASPLDASGRLSYTSNIIFDGIAQSCTSPSVLSATNITSTTADLQWTENGTATSWNIVYGEAGFNPDTEGTTVVASANPYAVTGLLSNTSYEFYVQADCGSGELSARVGPSSFTTICASLPLGYSADFDNNVPDACWSEATEGEIVDGPSSFGSSNWYASQYMSGGETIQTNVINLYFNNFREWLVSPNFDIPATGNYQLDISVIHGGTTDMTVEEPFGSDDEVQLLMTIDNGATWTNLRTWNSSNDPGIAGEDYVQDLTAALGSTVRFAFFGSDGTVNDPEDTYFAISKFLVRETPACPEPISLNASNIITDSADLSWSAGASETEWEYVVQLATEPAPTAGTSITATTYTATGLTENTDYVFYVRSVCGTEYSVFEAYAFTTAISGGVCETAIDVTALPYNTTDDTANYGDDYSGTPGASGCGTSFNYLDGDDVVYAYTAAADGTINVALSAIGSTYSGMFVYTDCADIGTTCVAGFGNSTSSADYDFDVAVTTGTTYYVVISTWATPQSTTYTLDITQILCPDPTALTATNITTTTADLGWTAGATETTWNIEVVDITAGDSQTMTATDAGVTANPFTVTGLASSNDYEFYLQADCGGTDGVSEWVGPFAFTTSCEVITVFPSTTDFTNNPPTVCWSEAGSGEVVDGPSGTSSDWRGNRAYEDGDGNAVNSNAINLYQNIDREWLLSPVYDIPVGTEYMLVVNVAVTNYSSSSTPTTAGDTMGSDDEVQLLMTIDNGATWTNLTTWNVANQPSVTGTEFIADLAAVSGNVQFALWASDGTVDDSEDYDFHIGQFEVSLSTLSTSQFSVENNFTYYPNPVENTLSLKGVKNIQNVAVYNMLGQEVLHITPNAVASEVDMSSLQTGTYFVKVTVENATKTIKIIKE